MEEIRRIGIIAALGCVVGCFAHLGAASPALAAVPRASGIWCNREPDWALSAEHERVLTQSLRRITGLCDLSFAADGSLSLGDVSEGGAATARQILQQVLCSGMAFIIQDHSNSAAINFGQLDEGLIYEDETRRRLMIWQVRLDFADFSEMQAPPEVRASFDEGFTLLHELLHGLGLKDTLRAEEVGECEQTLNRARAELGLPLRDQYFGEPTHLAPGITSVRLRFSSQRSPFKRPERRRHYLYFLLKDCPRLPIRRADY